MENIMVVAWMLFGIYTLVIFVILADLWSGIRKAKRIKIKITSKKLRKTIDKIARYYNVLIVLTIIDILQMSAVWYLDIYYKYLIPMIPIVTILGAIGISCIEIKSIFEKAENKQEIKELGDLAEKIISEKSNLKESFAKIIDYITENDSTT